MANYGIQHGRPARAKMGFLTLALFLATAVSAQHKTSKYNVPLQQRILNDINTSDSLVSVSGASDTVVPYLENKAMNLTLQIYKINSFYSHGFDTLDISMELPAIETSLANARRVYIERGRRLNLRSLNSFLVLLSESVDRLKGWKQTLEDYANEMKDISESVEKVVQDSTVKSLPRDTVLFKLAVEQLKEIDIKYKEVDSLQRSGYGRIGTLQKRVEAAFLNANMLVGDINFRMKQVKDQIWDREAAELWGISRSDYTSDLWSDIKDGIHRAYRVITVYMNTTWDTRSIKIIAFLVLAIWNLVNLYRMKHKKGKAASLEPVHFLTRNVLVACYMMVFTFGAFLEANIPMAYLHFTGATEWLCMAFLVYPYLTANGRRLGLWLIILWIGYATDDVLAETAYLERWMLVVLSIGAIVLSFRLLRSLGNLVAGINYPLVFRSLVVLMAILSTLSLGCNVAGRITLARLLGLAAVHSLMYAILLWVASNIVLEIVYVQSEAYKESRFSAFLNFTELRRRFQYFLRLVTSIFWIVMFSRNLSIYEPLYELSNDFINQTRTLGSMSFTFGSVIVFILIIWVSTILSQFINFLFGGDGSGKKNKIGTMALVVRLGVLTVGFLIAVGAAGIPLDKISLIIGALGVGIGFGLQTIVNNLVSGIILAFERPIQVGDQIEVAGKSGIVREIGIRASRIANFEGADIIIPNGDLLSQTLTNWTLTNRNRRVELRIRVDREADVSRVTSLITGILAKHDDIMKAPAPSVLISGFQGNWVEFQVLIWAEDLGNTGGLTHTVITELNSAFAAENIRLANPAQDIYVQGARDGVLQ